MQACEYRCFTESADGKYEYLHLLKRPGNGGARVYLDGVYAGEVDENCDEVQNRVRLFESIDLFGGIHTLYIVSDSDAPFELDAIRVTK